MPQRPPLEGTTIVSARPSTEGHAAAFALEVLEGPDVGGRLVVDAARPSRALVGTSAACDLRLRDPEVSRRHLAVEAGGAWLRVTDLGSTNGTLVDGLRVREASLRGGEILRVGATLLRVELAVARAEVTASATAEPAPFGRLVGASPAIVRLHPLLARLAASNVPLVIEGETGTGKEQLAEALHEQGPRADKPFVVLDCTAIAPSLIESELLGHERGAFTGAQATRAGVFERAHTGTLLIDEIGDLPLELQPKLLRVIERSTVTRVGGDRPLRVDVRVLAATRRDLDREVQLGRFRDDLFHRIAVTRIELPPLRERRGDVAILARFFCEELGGAPDALPAELLARWDDYAWPGNVRELRNAVARWLALGDLAEIPGVERPRAPAPPHAADDIAHVLALDLPFADARDRLLEIFEQRYVDRALAANGGNVTRAAATAGVTRRYLQRLKSKR